MKPFNTKSSGYLEDRLVDLYQEDRLVDLYQEDRLEDLYLQDLVLDEDNHVVKCATKT